jgi:deoxyadenosine/deoxycytidine kinase
MILPSNGTLVFNLRFILNSRFRRMIRESGKIIQDRTIYEDAHILHPILFNGFDDNRDFQNYTSLELMESTVMYLIY